MLVDHRMSTSGGLCNHELCSKGFQFGSSDKSDLPARGSRSLRAPHTVHLERHQWWCFGGGWSLNASIAAPVDATVIYYGNVARPAADLKKLKGPVMGHFATEDKWINREMVDGFKSTMQVADKPLTTDWYEANHGFANPTGARYDEGDTQLAWSRTLGFFTQYLA